VGAPQQQEDTRSKKSGTSQSILDKKKALFGLTPDNQSKKQQPEYFASNPDEEEEEEEEVPRPKTSGSGSGVRTKAKKEEPRP
jgi:hypothetical protein